MLRIYGEQTGVYLILMKLFEGAGHTAQNCSASDLQLSWTAYECSSDLRYDFEN